MKRQKAHLENLVKKRTLKIEEKNAMLMLQAEELNETNAILEERQQYIKEKEFVQKNGGEITVQSVVGQETTFLFTVPLKP